MKKWVEKNKDKVPCLLIAQKKLESGKLQGIPPQWVEELESVKGISTIVIEADGAAGRSLKAPGKGEPVVPQNTSLLVPVVGVDVLGCPLEERYVFRSEIAGKLLNRPAGSRVTEEIVAILVAETIKSRPEKARVIPFINKADISGNLEQARSLARSLLKFDQIKIDRVLLGQARNFPSVKEIFE
jgi:probable selenium-dependent hydroxylase accessory protein YqeC